MAPETAALISGIAVAVITTGPAYISSRTAARAATQAAGEEGAATREALDAASRVIGARVDALADELRSDVRELRTEVRDVHVWTAGHTAEHVLLRDGRDSE